MLSLIIKWVVLALSLVLLAWLIPGIEVATWGSAFLAGLVIGLINALIRPIAQFIALPLTVLTLGIFAFIVNALLFWLAGAIVPGFEVNTFLDALLGSLLLTLIFAVLDRVMERPRYA